MTNIKLLASKLEARQQKAAYLLVENEMLPTKNKRSQEAIAEEIGVTYKTIWEWRTKNTAFISYKNALGDQFFSEYRTFANSQLIKAMEGDTPNVKAIELFFKHQGLLTDKTQIETINSDGNTKTAEELSKEADDLLRMLDEGEA